VTTISPQQTAAKMVSAERQRLFRALADSQHTLERLDARFSALDELIRYHECHLSNALAVRRASDGDGGTDCTWQAVVDHRERKAADAAVESKWYLSCKAGVEAAQEPPTARRLCRKLPEELPTSLCAARTDQPHDAADSFHSTTVPHSSQAEVKTLRGQTGQPGAARLAHQTRNDLETTRLSIHPQKIHNGPGSGAAGEEEESGRDSARHKEKRIPMRGPEERMARGLEVETKRLKLESGQLGVEAERAAGDTEPAARAVLAVGRLVTQGSVISEPVAFNRPQRAMEGHGEEDEEEEAEEWEEDTEGRACFDESAARVSKTEAEHSDTWSRHMLKASLKGIDEAAACEHAELQANDPVLEATRAELQESVRLAALEGECAIRLEAALVGERDEFRQASEERMDACAELAETTGSLHVARVLLGRTEARVLAVERSAAQRIEAMKEPLAHEATELRAVKVQEGAEYANLRAVRGEVQGSRMEESVLSQRSMEATEAYAEQDIVSGAFALTERTRAFSAQEFSALVSKLREAIQMVPSGPVEMESLLMQRAQEREAIEVAVFHGEAAQAALLQQEFHALLDVEFEAGNEEAKKSFVAELASSCAALEAMEERMEQTTTDLVAEMTEERDAAHADAAASARLLAEVEESTAREKRMSVAKQAELSGALECLRTEHKEFEAHQVEAQERLLAEVASSERANQAVKECADQQVNRTLAMTGSFSSLASELREAAHAGPSGSVHMECVLVERAQEREAIEVAAFHREAGQAALLQQEVSSLQHEITEVAVQCRGSAGERDTVLADAAASEERAVEVKELAACAAAELAAAVAQKVAECTGLEASLFKEKESLAGELAAMKEVQGHAEERIEDLLDEEAHLEGLAERVNSPTASQKPGRSKKTVKAMVFGTMGKLARPTPRKRLQSELDAASSDPLLRSTV